MLLTIEKLIYGGNGLARLPADEKGPPPQRAKTGLAGGPGSGKAVFLPFVLEGERVEAEITEQKPGFARARAEKILEPSLHRIAPGCPYFGQCGGCHYQHSSYEHQLEIKAAILRETLRRVAKLELAQEIRVHASPPWNYRNRTRLRLRTLPFVLGYNRLGSSELLGIEQCPISSPLINRAIAALWELGRAAKVSADVTEIEFFTNGDDTQLLAELTVQETGWRRGHKGVPGEPGFGSLGWESDLLQFVHTLRAALPEITGVALFHATGQGALERQDIPTELQETFGTDHLLYSTSTANYQVSAGSFFQTNRFLTDRLVELVAEGPSGDYALDLYAGTGLFSLMLSQNFREVGAVEAAPFSFHDLQQNCPSNVTGYRVMVDKFLAYLPEGAKADLVVVDPPRAGLGEKVARVLLATGVPRITYVSCDPATLARDLTVLVESGYRIEEAHLVDLFPQTFHIESVFQLVR
ncbi:MAG TPA: class I SAM-dependent RNA methyltransferase [Terriglobales bacterium]|nr:class I SAM-dependent RNA methyltransferase [Terriglobales bacterium]